MLQQLGFKEYEAKCFVALSRLPKETAKTISQASDVPRTRVYDAIRVLEAKGLVETQHTNPQQFRAAPISEAVALLRQEYESRAQELTSVLENLDSLPLDREEEITHEVWSLSGATAIESRTNELIESADEEVVLVVGRAEAFTDNLAAQLNAAAAEGTNVVVGAVTDQLRDEMREKLSGVEVFTSGLEWLESVPNDSDDTTTISRLLLVDRRTILISSSHSTANDTVTESAVFGRGFDNGVVVITRRLMATGLNQNRDHGKSS
ncbi:transcriptional regulator [Salinigranum rubrum]|uniref:Transcriptional regulator n=1 Tax=Salinigranum rubrum TaxID=755307 RepID=A0A2I8VPM1_9EURY|nr:transcriptional regulator [Salinigranum rubrum]